MVATARRLADLLLSGDDRRCGLEPHERTPTIRSWYVGGDAFRFQLVAQPCPEDTVEGWRRRAERDHRSATANLITGQQNDSGMATAEAVAQALGE